MLQTLILTLKDGFELAVLSGLLFGFIYKIKAKRLNIYGYGGLSLALFFSSLLAYSLNNLRIEKEIETFLAFSGFILFLIIIGWIWYQNSVYRNCSVKDSKETREVSFLSQVIIFLFTLYLGIKFETELLLFPSKMTVDSMLTSGLNTELLLKYCGGVLGILLAFIFAFILVKAHKKMTLNQSLGLITLTYIINLLRLGILGFYGLIVKGIIPATPSLISGLAPFYNNISSFFYLFLGIITSWLLINAFRKEELKKIKGLNPAQIRKVKAKIKAKERWARFGVYIAGFLVLLLGVNYIYANQSVKLVPAVAIEPQNDKFIIQKEELEDDELHRYSYQNPEGILIKFFLIKKAEDAYGVVYDACEICGVAGYYQRDDQVICKRCDVVMNKMTIGFPGGCNPIPLEYAVDRDTIQIKVSDLLKRSEFFAK